MAIQITYPNVGGHINPRQVRRRTLVGAAALAAAATLAALNPWSTETVQPSDSTAAVSATVSAEADHSALLDGRAFNTAMAEAVGSAVVLPQGSALLDGEAFSAAIADAVGSAATGSERSALRDGGSFNAAIAEALAVVPEGVDETYAGELPNRTATEAFLSINGVERLAPSSTVVEGDRALFLSINDADY